MTPQQPPAPSRRDLPWLTLAGALIHLLFASGKERIEQQIRYFRAVAQIDFVGAYGFLSDLLW